MGVHVGVLMCGCICACMTVGVFVSVGVFVRVCVCVYVYVGEIGIVVLKAKPILLIRNVIYWAYYVDL